MGKLLAFDDDDFDTVPEGYKILDITIPGTRIRDIG
jgi:hypothetical protein